MINEYLFHENKLRTDAYAKNESDERFLSRLNEVVRGYELQGRDETPSTIPNVYIFGTLRSGKALIHQGLNTCLDVAWPTNLMARFWDAPVVGLRLSKILNLFDSTMDFKSDCAVTKGVGGPHEFGYFWGKWFNNSEIRIRRGESLQDIDWEGLRKELWALGNEADRPIVFQTFLPVLQSLDLFRAIQPNSLFIFVYRDLADVAVSTYAVRKRRYGDPAKWWAVRPRNVDSLLSRPPVEQISEQIRAIVEVLAQARAEVPQENVLVTSYRRYCANPADFVDMVASRLSRLGCAVKIRGRLQPFTRVTHAADPLYECFARMLTDVRIDGLAEEDGVTPCAP